MRRATAALLGTVAGTALVVGAKIGASPGSAAPGDNTAVGGVGGTAGPGAAGANGGRRGAASPSAGGATRTGAAPRTTAPRRTGSCRTVSGAAARIASPGVGTVTVTIKVCSGAITTASGVVNRSNWRRDEQAIPALNTLAVRYYKTSISQIHYSGATLTSHAYQSSLRSAMGKAGL